MVLFAFSAFGCTLPHFIFGNQLLHANNAFYGPSNLGTTSVMQNLITNSTDTYSNLCKTADLNNNGSIGSGAGNVSFTRDFKRSNFKKISLECQDELLAEQAAHTQITSAVLVIFFVSLLGVGVGQTAVSTLGIPYIDDNVASRESPIYIGKLAKLFLV